MSLAAGEDDVLEPAIQGDPEMTLLTEEFPGSGEGERENLPCGKLVGLASWAGSGFAAATGEPFEKRGGRQDRVHALN